MGSGRGADAEVGGSGRRLTAAAARDSDAFGAARATAEARGGGRLGLELAALDFCLRGSSLTGWSPDAGVCLFLSDVWKWRFWGEGGGSSGACLLAFSNFPSAAVEGFQLSSLTTFWGLMADFMSCPPSCLLILELPVLWRREPRFNIFEDLNPPVFSVGIAFGTWLLLPCV